MSSILSERNMVKLAAASSVIKYRLAFLSQENPADQRTWSGITYHLFKQMSSRHNVTWIHANDLSLTKRRILSLWNRVANSLGWKFTNHYFLNAFFLSKQVQSKLSAEEYDFVVVGAGESELIAYLHTKIPIIYIADSTFANMINYYPWHTGLSRLAIRQGNEVERNAIKRATRIIYSSQWAANSAVKDYGCSEEKISILDFGANLKQLPTKEEALQKPVSKKCHLLFLGISWERKGGSIAYETFLELKKKNMDCRLTIIGCQPQINMDEAITVIPFLDKNKASDFEQLYRILLETNFLIVPTRADCTPIVFSEAAAFGIPVLTTNTGGVTSVIKEGLNGFCFPIEAGKTEYSLMIEKIWNSPYAYYQLQKASRQEFDNRLNWQTWNEKFNAILQGLKN